MSKLKLASVDERKAFAVGLRTGILVGSVFVGAGVVVDGIVRGNVDTVIAGGTASGALALISRAFLRREANPTQHDYMEEAPSLAEMSA